MAPAGQAQGAGTWEPEQAQAQGSGVGTTDPEQVKDVDLLLAYTRCQKFFLPPLTLTLSPRWGERG